MLTSLWHPAGVTLPMDGPADASLIVPEVRAAIQSGDYSADILRQITKATKPGDRALVLGAGLGTASTLVAKSRGVKRVIAMEPNAELYPYLLRSHALNGVPWVETINALPAVGVRGRSGFFARHDVRSSSILPDDCSWELAMMIPCMDLNLILAEERINLLICEIPSAGAPLLADTDLKSVDRILVSCGDDQFGLSENAEIRAVLSDRGYDVEETGNALTFTRAKEAATGTDPAAKKTTATAS
jgi:hypothetical protein